MILVEEQIHDWQKLAKSHHDQVANDCVAVFFANLPPNQPPSTDELKRATHKAQGKATLLLTAEPVLAMLPQPPASPRQQEALRSSWQSLMQPWAFPPPAAEGHLAPWRLIVVAIVGSILGMLLFGELLEWLVNQREIGLLGGAVGGAAGFVYLFAKLAQTPKLGRFIGATQSFRYNHQVYSEAIRTLVKQQIDYGLLLLLMLTTNATETVQKRTFDPSLARAIVNLHGSTQVNLTIEADAVIQEARRLGLQGIDSSPHFLNEESTDKVVFQWNPDMEKHYRGFGVIEAGDAVVVVEEPLIQDDVLLEYGQVRKVRASVSR